MSRGDAVQLRHELTWADPEGGQGVRTPWKIRSGLEILVWTTLEKQLGPLGPYCFSNEVRRALLEIRRCIIKKLGKNIINKQIINCSLRQSISSIPIYNCT